MIETVRKTIERFNMLNTGERLLAALSGGADSVSLVLALKELEYDVAAVHVNHMIRGEESLRDQRFCEELCQKLGIKLFVRQVNVPEYSEKSGLSLETAARELRYQVFEEFGDGSKIATAHTADDCLETALFNLARGTGVKGLWGVPPVRGLIIRPLVSVTRKQVEAYLAEKNQTFVTDSTNLIPDCSRNKLRLLAIPELKKVNPQLLENYMRSRENFYEDSDFLDSEAQKLFEKLKIFKDSKLWGYDAKGMNALHDALKNRVIGEILKENGVEISREKICEIKEICGSYGKINIKKELFALCGGGVLRFETGRENKAAELAEIPVKIGESCDFLGRKVTVLLKDVSRGANVNINFTKHQADYDKIKGIIVLRNRRDGDKIALAGRGFTSSIKKLFNAGVPVHLRQFKALLADDEGLFFAEGFGVAERVRCDEKTRRIIDIIIE